MKSKSDMSETTNNLNFSRRSFINIASSGLCGLALSGVAVTGSGSTGASFIKGDELPGENVNLIGPYGEWASKHMNNELPALSFRRKEWKDIDAWRKEAKDRVLSRIAMPELGEHPIVNVNKTYTYDGLQIEEISWKLPYGQPVEAVVLKPADAREPLPGILAFHHHGADKYFGKRKIVQTADERHPYVVGSQEMYYDGLAWANEIAKRGYVVLVHDAFPFASRRVLFDEVPEHLRKGLNDYNPEDMDNIEAYNKWASAHEDIMAKSLFCAGTTWPGVWVAEDMKALDILCARKDVDPERIGCGGLSGGGMRTVFIGGLDSRIKCAVCVGLMTTWEDFMLNKSYTHTWMSFVPVLPRELDFPEILGMNVPSPVLVLNAEQDQLFTLPGMKKADEILQEVYKKANAADRYKCSFYPGGHRFSKEMQHEAYTWFDKWLK